MSDYPTYQDILERENTQLKALLKAQKEEWEKAYAIGMQRAALIEKLAEALTKERNSMQVCGIAIYDETVEALRCFEEWKK